MKRVHFFVSGEVQGVFYRHSSAKKARELGLTGFVKNVLDGRVEAWVEGEEKKVDEFINFCKNNPRDSNVKMLEITEEKEIKSPVFSNFEIRY